MSAPGPPKADPNKITIQFFNQTNHCLQVEAFSALFILFYAVLSRYFVFNLLLNCCYSDAV